MLKSYVFHSEILGYDWVLTLSFSFEKCILIMKIVLEFPRIYWLTAGGIYDIPRLLNFRTTASEGILLQIYDISSGRNVVKLLEDFPCSRGICKEAFQNLGKILKRNPGECTKENPKGIWRKTIDISTSIYKITAVLFFKGAKIS